VINVPREYDELGRPDGALIRKAAVDASIPLITDLQLARAVVEALRRKNRTACRFSPGRTTCAASRSVRPNST